MIVKETQLHTKYYFFLFFLLVNDVMGVTLENSALFIALYIHVADINIPISCTALKILEAPSLASQLMFAVLAIDRYIAIKYPFRHRKMMTTKLASGLVIAVWMITVVVYGILISATSFRYIPYFAQCEATNKVAIAYVMRTFSLLCLVVLVIAINAYLYYKILQVNKTQRQNLQLHGNTRTTSKLTAL